MRITRLTAAAALTISLVGAASAQAAAPSVSTGGASKITPGTVHISGTVNPKSVQTTYAFEYGTTKSYGAITPGVDVGAGGSNVSAGADVGGLAPYTVYHYRVVARSAGGQTNGKDRTFKTAKQPLSLALAATPNPVPYGSPTTLTGNLAGTDHAGVTVQLKQNAFPFTAGLQPFGNKLVTDKNGNFNLPLLSLTATTQFQAVVDGKPIASPILTLPVALRVGTNVSHTTVKRGRKIRFSGTVTPAKDPARVSVQKRSHGTWVTVGRTITTHHSSTSSSYGKTITVSSGGTYRVLISITDGQFVSSAGRSVTIHTHR